MRKGKESLMIIVMRGVEELHIGIGTGTFNDNVVNNYTRLRCEEKARMHLNTRGGCEESHSNKNSQKQNRLLSFDHDPKFGSRPGKILCGWRIARFVVHIQFPLALIEMDKPCAAVSL